LDNKLKLCIYNLACLDRFEPKTCERGLFSSADGMFHATGKDYQIYSEVRPDNIDVVFDVGVELFVVRVHNKAKVAFQLNPNSTKNLRASVGSALECSSVATASLDAICLRGDRHLKADKDDANRVLRLA